MSSIYIHIPFCKSKCIYCDFYSITNKGKIDSYVNALLTEIDIRVDMGKETPKPRTIYLGGGTPSLLSASQISTIVNHIFKKIDSSSLSEFTIEINPGEINQEKLKQYRNLGINRLSIGVQSLNENELKFLRRIHSPQEATDAIKIAQDAGFDNISCDVIYSIPKQSTESLQDTIDSLIASNIQHISAYTLMYEEGTPLYEQLKNGKLSANSDEKEEELYIWMSEYLNQNQFQQYEISSYARHGYQSQHNLNYWRRSEYLGFGAAAHSYQNGKRIHNFPDVEKYVNMLQTSELPIQEIETLSKEDELIEAIFLGLRAEGIHLPSIKAEFSYDLLLTHGEFINELIANNQMKLDGDNLKLTPKGYALCDYLSLKLIEKNIAPTSSK